MPAADRTEVAAPLARLSFQHRDTYPTASGRLCAPCQWPLSRNPGAGWELL